MIIFQRLYGWYRSRHRRHRRRRYHLPMTAAPRGTIDTIIVVVVIFVMTFEKRRTTTSQLVVVFLIIVIGLIRLTWIRPHTCITTPEMIDRRRRRGSSSIVRYSIRPMGHSTILSYYYVSLTIPNVYYQVKPIFIVCITPTMPSPLGPLDGTTLQLTS